MNALRAASPLRVAGVEIVPVVRVWLHRHAGEGGVWAAGGREPVAVVIRDASGLRAMNMAGEEVTLDTLLETVEGLAAAVRNPPH